MSVYNRFQKRVAGLVIDVSAPWPRQVEIKRDGEYDPAPFRIRLEDARDLHYALGRLIELAEEDDRKGDSK